MQAIEHWNTHHFTLRRGIHCWRYEGNALGQTLVGSRVIKVQDICFNLAEQLPFAQDEQVIQTFPT